MSEVGRPASHLLFSSLGVEGAAPVLGSDSDEAHT